MSALLQSPIVRTGLLPSNTISSGHKIPSSKDIPPVALTNIPHVDASAFQPYMKQAGALYEAFQQAKEGDVSNSQARHQRRPSKADPFPPISSPGVAIPPERPQAKRKVSGGTTRRGQLTVAPLSTIPTVYFEPDFRLENPRTFDVVSERSEIVRPQGPNGAPVTPTPSGRKILATNAILQEKLSWYMDTVEVHLISSISTASTSFFAALGSLRELHAEATASVEKIKALREDLAYLDRNMAKGGLKIVELRRRRENMQKLADAVQQIHAVTETFANCEEQTGAGEIEKAMQGLYHIEALIAGERFGVVRPDFQTSASIPDRLIDLRGITALEGIDRDVTYLRQRIGKSFEARLLESLLTDLRRHVDGVPLDTTFQRWDQASQRSRGTQVRLPSAHPAYLDIHDSLRENLRKDLQGLAHSDGIKPATAAYREAVWKEIKSLIRRHLPSSSDDDTESTMSASTQGGRRMTQQEKSSILARNLRDMDARDAEVMLRKIYANVGEALRRLGTQSKVVLDITSAFSNNSLRRVKSPMSPPASDMTEYMNGAALKSFGRLTIQQEDIQQTLDMTSLLEQAVDIAQAQITKILKVRSEQSTRLPLPNFLKYFHLNRLFADECEAVSGRGGVALKTVVNSHIKEFVQQAGQHEREKLVQNMDKDHWDAKDFGDRENEVLATIIQASTMEIERWTNMSKIWLPQETLVNGNGAASEPNTATSMQRKDDGEILNGNPVKDKIRSASIDEQKFILPSSALVVLAGMSQFEQLVAGIPGMTLDITNVLLEYLKLFNSRSSQLILGAGATRSAGLKNITTKHLALASQALSFVTALIPYLREFVRRRAPSGTSLMIEFDKVKRLYQEHQSGINDKLVAIMSGRATTHVNSMKRIEWDSSSQQGVSPYMETLVKETTTLHKVLSKHLPEMTVQTIMGPVFTSYREQWGEAFACSVVQTQAGKERYAYILHFVSDWKFS